MQNVQVCLVGTLPSNVFRSIIRNKTLAGWSQLDHPAEVLLLNNTLAIDQSESLKVSTSFDMLVTVKLTHVLLTL